jgi:hypothetical protein
MFITPVYSDFLNEDLTSDTTTVVYNKNNGKFSIGTDISVDLGNVEPPSLPSKNGDTVPINECSHFHVTRRGKGE